MSRGLLLRLYRISQRKNFRHDGFDLPGIDQLRDLSEIVGIGVRGDSRATDSVFLKLGRIRSRDQRHDDATFLYHAIRPRECFFADWIEHGIHIFGNIFEFGFGVIHCNVRAELLEQILVCCRGGRDHPRTARFCDLHRKTTNSARPAVNKDCLPWLQFRYIH